MSTIKVKFDKESKLISVYNNGKGILIGIHKELNVYVPEMLFGQLMTSSDHSNGRNGLGAKFTNIFSTQFTVETTDATQKKKYIQSFYNNMSKIDEPIISNYDDDEEEHTMISFIPDLMRFGMTELTDDVIALLSKRVYDIAEAMKDTEVFLNDKQIIGLKRKTINVEKLDDAVNAGTSLAQNCTLILTEGDSAKAFALSGLDVVSERNNWGVYPLRGKLLNVRNASPKKLSVNREVKALQQILGLQHNKEYCSVEDLRYGKLMIMTDQDLDGSHIKGLIIIFFDHFYPSLLKQSGFLQEFITPIIKCTKNKNTISFYTIPEYEEWKRQNENGKGWMIKYYKGLGTSTSDEAKQYFSDLRKHVKIFKPMDEEDHKLVEMAFTKKDTDERKTWISGIQDGAHIDYLDDDEITIKNFINKELSLFSLSDNIRSIPSVIDGLKPGQRKVLYSCIKKNLVKEEQLKVSSLSGFVSECSAYHHGEASLHSTIISLAQDFVGSNNINLLEPIGQFGKRNDGGKSAASARYINTRLTDFARLIYHPDDDILLDYLNDDGKVIEPKWYVPIIPMVLVNGAEGIGTGWSTSIPNFNPRDIIHNLRRKINAEEMIPMHPWYCGFYGEIKQNGANKYTSYGKITKKNDTHIIISELPVCKWTEDYKSKTLTDLRESNTIRNISRNNCTNERVDLEIELTIEQMEKAEKEGLEKTFQLTTALATSNMTCFDPNNKLAKYETAEDIIKEFYHERLKLYVKRKNQLIKNLQKQVNIIDNKIRFLHMKLDTMLKFEGLKKAEIIKLLKFHKFDKIGDTLTEEDSSKETEINRNVRGYDYIMRMTCWSFSREELDKYENRRKQLSSELDLTSRKSPQDIWLDDLDKLEAAWDEFVNDDQENVSTYNNDGEGDIDELSESNLNIETNLQKGNKTTSNKERKRKLVDIDVETSEPSNQCGRKIKRTNFGI
ncbi:6314_t:CDS:2 [Entrophospora sp. SA101]|nr:6314_t:CDS:2 [Entrophospora sp. SA101]